MPSILTKKTNTNQTVTPNSGNGQHHNNENKTPVLTGIDQTATPNNDNKANGFVDAQFSMPNEQETKYKESKKDFYSSSHNNPNKVRYGFMVVGFVCQQRIVMT
ncbi:hypothetical protein [Wolbachia endosymbiont (group A) of Epistrophe grossularia]|uniref:hypothetical protein n=1 Tax=Wolbachia endosymbiont (group A) of Epistrophe grossularia TaxID=2954008 RepID=UPI00222E7497|nr:hypothetical protein [Wolbachia endosymbiont (group A) of Epistrophe grossularia]